MLPGDSAVTRSLDDMLPRQDFCCHLQIQCMLHDVRLEVGRYHRSFCCIFDRVFV